MSRLPTLRPSELVAALRRAGFEPVHQKGSHLVLRHPDGRRSVVPMHSKDLRRPTMMTILAMARIDEDQLRELL